MELDLQVHKYKVTSAGVGTLQRVVPYVRLRSEEGPPVFIQGGQYFYETGDPVPEDELPDWVEAEVAKMSASAKREAGIE